LLNEAGLDGWELMSITPNNFAYLKRRFDGPTAPAREMQPAARATRPKVPTNASNRVRTTTQYPLAHLPNSVLSQQLLLRNSHRLSAKMEFQMATFTVQQGKRYRATISLGFFERFATTIPSQTNCAMLASTKYKSRAAGHAIRGGAFGRPQMHPRRCPLRS